MQKLLSHGKTREVTIVALLFVAGIAFRLWFISLAPQPFVYDQEEYQYYTYKMFYINIFSPHTYRTYPYPLFLTLLYKVVGYGNHYAVFFTQAVHDSLVGVMLYLLLRNAFRDRKAAWIGLVLYAFNPFTSGYVGVVLSEVLSAFFILATIFAGYLFLRRPSILRGLAVGVIAGLAAETRNAAFVWAAIPVGFLLAFVSLRRNKLKYAAVLVGLVLTVLYPLYVNWRYYHEINITTVDSFYAKEFFNGVMFRRLPPFTVDYPWDTRIMFREYYSEFYPDRTAADRRAMAQKYMDKTWAIIKSDPWDYVRVRFEKMWYVWQKENIFFYREPGYEQHRMYTYALNLIILGLAASGIIMRGRTFFSAGLRKFMKKRALSPAHSRDTATYLWWCIVGSIAYATVGFSFTHAEYRLTIPFYPLLYLVASLGITSVWYVVSRVIVRSRS